MNNLELAKNLLENVILANYFKVSSADFFQAAENRADKTMIYLKVFWNESRFNYVWGKGFLTENDKDNYLTFLSELASHVEFLGVDQGKLTIDSSAGFETYALGLPYVFSEPMNFTFALSIEKACELFAVIQQHYQHMVRSISPIELFEPICEREIDSLIEGKRDQARAEIIQKLSVTKRSHYAYLPAVFGFCVYQLRSSEYRTLQNEATKKLLSKIDQLNNSIHQSLIDANVLLFSEQDNKYVRFINKADFKKRFNASERKALYNQLPELKAHFEPSKDT